MIKSIKFSLLSPQLVRKLSVVEVTKAELYDNDGFPLEGGVMDPRLGVIDPGLKCRTCGKGMGACYGHFGNIELIKPIFNVLYSKYVYKILKMTCRNCSRVIGSSTTTAKKCSYCATEQIPIKFEKPYTFMEGEVALTALQVRERFEKIPDEDLVKINLIG